MGNRISAQGVRALVSVTKARQVCFLSEPQLDFDAGEAFIDEVGLGALDLPSSVEGEDSAPTSA